jgi:hypothetical protein
LDEGLNWFQMGGLLTRMKDEGWHHGCGSFQEMVEAEFGFGISKAKYLIQIYRYLLEADITWDMVEGLGWSKMRLLCSHAIREGWSYEASATRVAEAKDMSYKALEKHLKGTTLSGPDAPDKLETLTFKAYPEQAEIIHAALGLAKYQSGTDSPTKALEYISMEHLGNPPAPAPVLDDAQIQEWMDTVGWEMVLFVFEKAFPKLNMIIEIIDDEDDSD